MVRHIEGGKWAEGVREYGVEEDRGQVNRGMEMACVGRGEAPTGFWWGKSEGRSSFGIPGHKWEDNIRMGFFSFLYRARK